MDKETCIYSNIILSIFPVISINYDSFYEFYILIISNLIKEPGITEKQHPGFLIYPKIFFINKNLIKKKIEKSLLNKVI